MAPERIIPLTPPPEPEGEVTIYVKGFLARGEAPDDFGDWLDCHQRLGARHGWGVGAVGYSWESGHVDGLHVPAVGAAKTVYDLVRHARGLGRANPISAVGFFAGEQLVRLAARFVSQYWAAMRSARERSDVLARHLAAMSRAHERVRVVAHSLGCLQVIEAVSHLDVAARPDEIHLCAPACREDDVADGLGDLAKGPATLYFTANDLVLETAFRAMSRGRALGAAGPDAVYSGLDVVDVGEHFGFWVHNEYKKRFADFAKGPAPG